MNVLSAVSNQPSASGRPDPTVLLTLIADS
jgi:hypothetical protein